MLRWSYTRFPSFSAILLASALAQQAGAEDSQVQVPSSRAASSGSESNEAAISVQAERLPGTSMPTSKHAPRVRIGLRLTPFAKVVGRDAQGKVVHQSVPTTPLRHTLRARLSKTNHFYVGDYHIETQPLRWVRQSRRYEVRLNLYRRYGSYGQLEENIGTIDLAGVLEEQADQVFVLVGVARKRLRDKLNNPVVDVVAGFAPPPAQGPAISRSSVPSATSRGASGSAGLQPGSVPGHSRF